ncbi:MAG: EF-hand domain-containing protein [Planctomycetota bacterium]
MVRSAGFALVVVALTMWLGTVADAAPGQGKAKGARPQGKGQGREIPAEILKRFDKDGDGKLNDAERDAAKKAREERGGKPGQPGRPGQPGGGDGKMREEVLKRFDKDGDGKLNDAEKAAAKKAHDERANKNKK